MDFCRILSYSACRRAVVGVSGAVLASSPFWRLGVDGTEVEGVLTELFGVRGEKIELDPLERWEDGVCGKSIEFFPGVFGNIADALLGDFVGDLSNDKEDAVGNGMLCGLLEGSCFIGDFPRDSLDGGDCGMERTLAEETDLGEEEANILVNKEAALGWAGS